MKMAAKPHINLVVIGHVDHGKSTLVGRLLYETGTISEQDIERLKKEAAALGKATFEFAYVLDATREERTRGVTIDLSHMKFETDKYYFTIIDAPGHKDFIKNMITGAAQADAAILVVAAKEGIQPQTKEHAFLARVLGIKQFIVAINKMDTVNYSEEEYKKVKEELEKFLKTAGFKTDEIKFIPISALEGENVTKKLGKMPWWNGPTVLEALNELKEPEKPIDLPLRLPIQDVYSITGIGTVPVGRVETGVMKVGQKVIFEPADVSGEVKSIEMHHEQMQEAKPGDNIGFNVRGVTKEQIKRGDVVGPVEKPPTVAKEFTAQIVILHHPTAISKGYTPVLHAHTTQVPVKFKELKQKLDPRTGQVAQENPDMLKTGDAAVVVLEPQKPLVIEKRSEIPKLSSFAVRDMGETVGAGFAIDIVKR
jgi:elongation factor 1-alpha